MEQKKYQDWLAFLRYGVYGEDSAFLKFAVLWLSFNAYLNEKYPTIKGDFSKVNTFGKTEKAEKVFNDCFNIEELLNKFDATKFSGRQFVEDLNTRKDDYRKYFTSENNTFMDYLAVVYQIRCNFFHGDKIPFDSEDKNLVEWVYDSFMIFWTKYLET